MFKAIDAFILYVFRSGNEMDATIKNIIPVIDYLDHSIPNYSELDESLRRLSMIGLITWNPPGIQATPVYRKWRDAHFKNGKRMSLHKEIKEIKNYLAVSFSAPELIGPEILDKTEFDKAVKDYKAGFSHYPE